MELEIGKVYEGFKLVEKKDINEINSTGILFEHEKSGARLFYLKNEDDNKVFSISFRTPPKDSTGVPHILEHSVLCGSRKFPLKEPFVELIKGSMNTFLNAFTFPDKTMYPVASRNNKDFLNLMNVYLDAVFYPNIYKYKEIMMQEGWHYELENKDAEISYKGVVYNEMKGAFSSPESILFRKISEYLFPDTQYGVESGGDPDFIPNLTQEQFLAFHKKYYHPSNSYIYLYGDMDIIEKLKFLNEEYLKDFTKENVDSELLFQKPFEKIHENTIKYPISSTEKEEDKTFLSMNFSVGNATNTEIYLAFDILEHLLLETPSAPLKKALIDAKIGKDVFGSFEGGILQPMFSIIVKNSNEDQKENFVNIVRDTLSKLVRDGIDKKLIEASINIKEFQLREADYQGYPKGLIYSMKAMDSWLYDEKPWIHLAYEDTLNKIKTSLQTRYFEDIIEKYILKNNHGSILIVKPAKGLEEEKEAAIKKRLKEYKESLSDKEIEELINNTNALKERQVAQDSPENLKKIPLLSIEDIDLKAKKISLIEKEESGVKVLYHPEFTNGIIYMNMYFDTEGVKEEMLPYISILSTVIGKLSTEKYQYEDLVKEINIYTGGIRYAAETYAEKGDCDKFYPKFVVKSKVLTGNISKLVTLLGEIIGYTKYDDYKRIKEIIQETKSRLEMIMFEKGHIVSASHLFSYFSPMGKYDDIISGLSFYKFIADLEKNFDEKAEEISNNLKEVAETIFNKNNLIVNVTADEKDYEIFAKELPLVCQEIGDSRITKVEYKFKFGPENEGLMTSGKVQYVAKAYNFIKLGYSYTGGLLVLKTIANYDYLWNRVRVQGGAYGSFASFQKNGNMFFTSYRDPNLKETVNAYDNAGEFFKNFNADDRQMTKYIIGTISDLDFPLTPSMKGERAAEHYIKHIKYEDIQKEREEVINVKIDDIKGFGEMISSAMEKNYVCVIGNEEKIKQNKSLFNNLVNLFE
ncbi:insulinase family protein [Clostridium scatologenes]|uniref:Peptidase M16C associated domain protein n=1 Tax=Clostridium scatologenes TaxID=1548 RepID=A0A0E3GS97_CLOSL|nr:insulinase family protein [Clostridium scatologenes]AKA71691.1 Peptidase M16C associated domain protein [Clostridium scatologenes]